MNESLSPYIERKVLVERNTVIKNGPQWTAIGDIQVIFGNFAVSLQSDGVLKVHCWPSEHLVVTRGAYKDARNLKIRNSKYATKKKSS